MDITNYIYNSLIFAIILILIWGLHSVTSIINRIGQIRIRNSNSKQNHDFTFKPKIKLNWRKPIFYYLFGFLIIGSIVLFFDWIYWGNLPCLLVEANGFLIDILFFGIALSIYEHYKKRNDDIERWQEEIYDFSGWKEDEAMYRNVGNIRRLVRSRKSNIFLMGSYLRKAFLGGLNLSGSILIFANLEEARLEETDLTSSELKWANLKGAHLVGTKLRKANLTGANLTKADLDKCDLTDAILIDTKLDIFESENDRSWPKTEKEIFVSLQLAEIVGIEGIMNKYKIKIGPGGNSTIVQFVER